MKHILLATFLLFLMRVNAQETILFTENFDDGNFNGWTIIDDPEPRSGPSNWLVEAGELRQTSNIWSYDPPAEFIYHLGSHAVSGDTSWTDYSLNAILRSTDNDGIGLIVRYQDPQNYYRILLMSDAGNSGSSNSAIQRIQKFVNGEPRTLLQNKVSSAFPPGYFSLTADVRGDSIKAYLNGVEIGAVEDDEYQKGKIGVLVYANSGARFDSITVSEDRFIYDTPTIEINYPVLKDRQPYIQNPTTDKVEIAWRSVEPFIGRVDIGAEKGNYTRTVVELDKMQKHHVEIDGLAPNTTYFYRVWNESELVLEDYTFRTAKPDSVDNVSFFVLGDSGVDTDVQRQVRDRMVESFNADDVDFAIHVGDVHQGDGSTYDRIYFDIYNELLSKINVFTCIGNHDTYTDNAAPYLDDFYLPSNNDENSERYYSFRWGTAFFINLDSNLDMRPGSSQYKFLTRELDSEAFKTAEWTFAYFHHPPYCEYWPAWDGDEVVRQHLVPLFEDYDIDVVFNGHTHAYEYGELNHVHYVISGGGGGSLDPFGRDFEHITNSQAKHHFSRVDINGKELVFTATDLNGEDIHTFKIDKRNQVSTENEEKPTQIQLKQNYPNPFNPVTTIEYQISQTVQVQLTVFDSTGRKISELVNAFQPQGNYQVQFNGSNLASGVYIVELNAGDFREKIQITLVK
jgi:predicted phosphodiesterase